MGDLDKATEQYWFNEVKRVQAVILSYEEEAAIDANFIAELQAQIKAVKNQLKESKEALATYIDYVEHE